MSSPFRRSLSVLNALLYPLHIGTEAISSFSGSEGLSLPASLIAGYGLYPTRRAENLTRLWPTVTGMTQRPLWAPWRLDYIRQNATQTDCPFCIASAGKDETLVIARGERCFVMLNRFPYASGHLMVLPARHVGDLARLDHDELAEAMALVQDAVRVLMEVMAPNGFNVGLNLGQAAGAGIDEHIHLHVVPRWVGDTNFMPMLAGTHVLPQALAATRDELVARWPHV